MRRFLLSLLVLSLCLLSGAAFALSADDFIPPVQAKAGEQAELLAVKDEAAVTSVRDDELKADVKQAATLQDAINKIVEKPKQGCEIARRSPEDGLTFVATGHASYATDYKNPVAIRLGQRQAYVAAFMDAKAQMAMTVGQLVVRGATNFDMKLDGLDTEDASITNLERDLSESQLVTVRTVLKGYVTYHVQDNEQNGEVFVTIVSSPKSRGVNSRMGTDGIIAENLNDGLNGLLAEIQNNLVPPVGGRIITVKGTGEVAWVGFGSAVVRKHKFADVQSELNLEAERIANLRAIDALAGIILGDDTKYVSHADEQARSQMRDIEEAQQHDETTKGTKEEMQAYENSKREMRMTRISGSQIQGLRNGTLPPGVIRKSYLDDKEYFAYGIAVYIPSVTQLVGDAAAEMEETQIVKPIKPKKSNKSNSLSSSGSSNNFDNANNADGETGVNEAKGRDPVYDLKLEKGPTGIVEQDL